MKEWRHSRDLFNAVAKGNQSKTNQRAEHQGQEDPLLLGAMAKPPP